jgi:hypothetical protein
MAMTIEVDGRRIRLDREFLNGTTRDGDPTLLHGYAITGHVAQGLTVDHSLVLATGGIGSEWAYVALSRGRESNRIYVAEIEDDPRAEFAPAESARVGAVERLRRSLASSDAQVLAIDAGTPAAREVESDLAAATLERRALQERELVARASATDRGGSCARDGGQLSASRSSDGQGRNENTARGPSRLSARTW